MPSLQLALVFIAEDQIMVSVLAAAFTKFK